VVKQTLQELSRKVDTPYGPIEYVLRKKKMKNTTLRIEHDRTVVVSIPLELPNEQADAFVRSKCKWVTGTLAEMRRIQCHDMPEQPSPERTFELLRQALERAYPRIASLGVAMPVLKVRRMKSQWGNCHWRQGYITLNTALARCPEDLREYVALHELVHFLHHNHGEGFYATMESLMPDWREKRSKLEGYTSALVPPKE